VGFTTIGDAALIIEDEAVAWTRPAPTAPPAWPAASQPPRTGGSALPSSGDTSAKTRKIFGARRDPATRQRSTTPHPPWRPLSTWHAGV